MSVNHTAIISINYTTIHTLPVFLLNLAHWYYFWWIKCGIRIVSLL
jgi:hypothetical protein